MQQGLKTKNLKFFTGLENYEENNSIPEDKFFNVQNARFGKKVLSSAKKNQSLGNLLVGGTKDGGMFEYIYFDGSTTYRKAIRFYNRTFYEFNETTQIWDSITTVWPNIEDKPISAVGAANALYVIGQTNKTGNGVGKLISGIDFVFTVSGVSVAPDANTVYSVTNAGLFVVLSTSIVAGSGTITAKRLINVTDPAVSGTLTKVGGGTVGDASITYSSYTKASAVSTSFTVIANSPEGVGIEYYLERLVAIGDPSFVGRIIASQPTTNPAEFYKIENFNTTTGATVYSASKFSNLMAIRVLNNNLYYWGSDAVYEHTPSDIASGDNPRELSRTGGAINQKSTIVVENDVWFLSSSNEVRSLGTERNLGENPRTKNLTEVIKSTMDILDPIQDNPVMTYNKRLFKLHLKTRNSPTNNFTIIFDYNTGGWTTDRGEAVNVATVWKSEVIYGEDSTGQAYKDETGYSLNGAAFTFSADTPFYDDGRPDIFKRARYIYVRGQQSYTQSLELRLYRNGDYNIYSSYIIPSPQARGVSQTTYVNDGTWGSSEQGGAVWGGTPTDSGGDNLPMYRFERLISIDRQSNLYAIGLNASINGGKVVLEQLILKLIDNNENYKRADQ